MNSQLEADLDFAILEMTRQAMLEEILVRFYGWIVL